MRAIRLFPHFRLLRVPVADYWHEHAPVTPAPVYLARPSRQYIVYLCALTVCVRTGEVGRVGRVACGMLRVDLSGS